MKNWSQRTRIFLGAMAFMIFLTLGFITLAVWKVSEFLTHPLGPDKIAPLVIREPKTLIGNDLFTKTQVFKQTETSFGDMVYGSISEANDAKREIATASKIDKEIYGYSDAHYDTKTGALTLLGKFGVQIIDREGKLKQEMLLEPEVTIIKIFGFEKKQYKNGFDKYKIIDLEDDGRLEYLAWGSLDGISVFDSLGKKIFSRNKMEIDVSIAWDKEKMEAARKETPNVKAAAVGDLDGDGVKEIIFTTSNDEIIAVDRSGKEIWKQNSEYAGDDLRTFDLDGDSRSEIIELFSSNLVVRDSEGHVTRKIDPDSGSVEGVMVAEGENKKTLQFARISKNKVNVFDENGNSILDGEAPLSKIPREKIDGTPMPTPVDLGDGLKISPDLLSSSDDAYDGKFSSFSFKKGEAKYLAAAASYWEFDRSIFYIYSPDGKLIYHEILPEECRSIITIPNENGSDDLLFVGKNTVWRYKLN